MVIHTHGHRHPGQTERFQSMSNRRFNMTDPSSAVRGWNKTGQRRRGTALLVCIFTMSITAVLVISVLDTETIEMSALRNNNEYERALYLAGAAVHHALAELEQNSSWRSGISSTEYPTGSGNVYSATLVDGAGATVVITGTGSAGSFTRNLEVSVQY